MNEDENDIGEVIWDSIGILCVEEERRVASDRSYYTFNEFLKFLR